MKRLLCALAAVLVLVLPQTTFAWARLGHWLVGELAARQLTPQARAQVALLLAGEPDPTLGGIASWADDLRNTDPARFKQTSRWHYIDLNPADDCGYDPPRDCADGACVIEQIEAQRKVLADPAQPLEARRDALKFLVHLVGDVHQPLHAGAHYDAGGHDDAGGNKFQVSLRTDIPPEAYAQKNYVNGVMGTNLHAVWDYYILASAGRTQEKYARKLRWRVPRIDAARLGTPQSWAQESCRIIDGKQLYPPQHVMDRGYLDAMRPLAEQRVEIAAARLAELLNETLQ
jgi:hypothetical protein